MAFRIPRWLRWTGFTVIGIAAVGAFVGRTVDLRGRLVRQLAVPHGPGGWVAALTMPMAH